MCKIFTIWKKHNYEKSLLLSMSTENIQNDKSRSTVSQNSG